MRYRIFFSSLFDISDITMLNDYLCKIRTYGNLIHLQPNFDLLCHLSFSVRKPFIVCWYSVMHHKLSFKSNKKG